MGLPSTSSIHDMPLHGMQLIDASAGTGKTHAIAALYLRLLIETELNVDRILVLTFTRAACAELRERIRRAVASLLAGLAAGQTADAVAAQALPRIDDPRRAEARLRRALSEFDAAQIETIHGFCQRLLGELAFSAGMPFASEVLTDESEVLDRIARDFWRREIYGENQLFAEYLQEVKRDAPERLLADVQAHLGRPRLRVDGGEPADCSDAESRYEDLFRQVACAWREHAGELLDLLTRNGSLNRNRYRRESVVNWVTAVTAVMAGESSLCLPEAFAYFTPERIVRGTNKGQQSPKHPLLDLCGALAAAAAALRTCYAQRLAALRLRLLTGCERELRAHNRRMRVLSYRDMLVNVANALQGGQGERIRELAVERYGAALVDEFQDTDPLQYDILRRIYGGTGRAVFLVGDPKQAIYGFRGADIFAYLQARSDAIAHHALSVNRRSEPRLIEAVNAIFGAAPNPFVIEEINYQPVAAADEPPPPLLIDGKPAEPMHIWLLERDGAGPLSKAAATRQAVTAVAGEVGGLLALGMQRRATLPDRHSREYRPLRGDDVAILVRTHRQAQAMRDALASVGVACVLRTQMGVFATHEAEELARVLAAVAEPSREAVLHAALVSDMLGWSGGRLYALMNSEGEWQAVSDRFHACHALWQERGFFVMLHTLMAEQGVAARLLGMEDGERRLTNLLHLAELLHGEARAAHAGMEQLIRWLDERRHAGRADAEEELLRLESDEQLVQVITVHQCKGLEYPIVFCPFAWDARDITGVPNMPFLYHDVNDNHASVLHLSEAIPAHVAAQWQREALSEELRLFYVALTRARQRCVVLWGAVKGAQAAAPGWLLHAHRRPDPATPFDADAFAALTDEDVRADLAVLADSAGGVIGVSAASLSRRQLGTLRGAGGALAARVFRGTIRPPWQLSSYTSLLRRRDVDEPDYDASGTMGAAAATSPLTGIAAFPRGARAGRCLHAMLERLDFTDPDPQHLRGVVNSELARHGFESHWGEVLVRTLRAVLDVALNDSGLRLASVTMDRRMNELEFHYPVARVTVAGLKRVLGPAASPMAGIDARIDTLQFAPTQGYMKGYIDLVFEAGGRYYLVDYKSNWLGTEASAYDERALAETMQREAYTLQYLLYAVGLHRFLRQRLRDYDYARHFGGVLYLFLRGIEPAYGRRYGVYSARPAAQRIAELDAYLATGS
ncbi:MAG: exodeoxyribonuclease V subunit beta [Chromatiales bacterium]